MVKRTLNNRRTEQQTYIEFDIEWGPEYKFNYKYYNYAAVE